jgi:hypothetical protein
MHERTLVRRLFGNLHPTNSASSLHILIQEPVFAYPLDLLQEQGYRIPAIARGKQRDRSSINPPLLHH